MVKRRCGWLARRVTSRSCECWSTRVPTRTRRTNMKRRRCVSLARRITSRLCDCWLGLGLGLWLGLWITSRLCACWSTRVPTRTRRTLKVLRRCKSLVRKVTSRSCGYSSRRVPLLLKAKAKKKKNFQGPGVHICRSYAVVHRLPEWLLRHRGAAGHGGCQQEQAGQ